MYTPLQEEEIRQEFARRRMFQVILAVIIAPVLVVLVALRRSHGAGMFGYDLRTIRIVGMVAALVYVAIATTLWRCPGCKARLSAQLRPEKCPNCEVVFRALSAPK